MTPSFTARLWRCCVLLGVLLFAAPTWAADILLTAEEDGPGVQTFVQALAQQRPEDSVKFTLALPLPTRVFLTRVESQAHGPKGLTALWLGLRGLR